MRMPAHGCSCLRMAAHGCAWLRMAAHGCSWLLMAAHGCSWLLMAAHGCSWLLMAAHACAWLRMAAHGCSWLLMAAHGCAWPQVYSAWAARRAPLLGFKHKYQHADFIHPRTGSASSCAPALISAPASVPGNPVHGHGGTCPAAGRPSAPFGSSAVAASAQGAPVCPHAAELCPKAWLPSRCHRDGYRYQAL